MEKQPFCKAIMDMFCAKITAEHPELPPLNIKENEENFIIFDGCNVFNTYIL